MCLVVRISNFWLPGCGLNLIVGHLQAVLSKLLTYSVLRSAEREMSGLLAIPGEDSAADLRDDTSACCTAGPIIRKSERWMAA